VERTLFLRRVQASVALWGGLLALVTALAAIGFTEPSMIQLPVTTLLVLLLGWGLRGEVGLLATGLVPGMATIGWLVVGPALAGQYLASPALVTLVAVACAGLPLWLFQRVRGGQWLHRLHTMLFAAPTSEQMDSVLAWCTERVRDRSERTFPGGYTIGLTAKPSILRINGSRFQTSARLTVTDDVEGARALMSLVTDEVIQALGWRAWPMGTAVCEVAIDSAHTAMRRAAKRLENRVAFVDGGMQNWQPAASNRS
jgi:hypothetical protein